MFFNQRLKERVLLTEKILETPWREVQKLKQWCGMYGFTQIMPVETKGGEPSERTF